MHMQLTAFWMDPHAFPLWCRNLLRTVHHLEGRLSLALSQILPDVDVSVALRAHFIAVVGDSPLVAPKLFGLLDGSCPQLGSFLGAHVAERV